MKNIKTSGKKYIATLINGNYGDAVQVSEHGKNIAILESDHYGFVKIKEIMTQFRQDLGIKKFYRVDDQR